MIVLSSIVVTVLVILAFILYSKKKKILADRYLMAFFLSIALGVLYDWSKPYSEQNPTDYYFDLTASWRIDGKRVASIFSIQVKNLLGSPSEFNWTYNYRTKRVKQSSVVVVVPNISYRVEF